MIANLRDVLQDAARNHYAVAGVVCLGWATDFCLISRFNSGLYFYQLSVMFKRRNDNLTSCQLQLVCC